jgi:oxygen-independent coproporphyrinogen-3 oxidase
MCQFYTSWQNNTFYFEVLLPEVLEQLDEMIKDGLLILESNALTVTEKGKPFIRNICMAFDLRMKRKVPQTQLFSLTV